MKQLFLLKGSVYLILDFFNGSIMMILRCLSFIQRILLLLYLCNSLSNTVSERFDLGSISRRHIVIQFLHFTYFLFNHFLNLLLLFLVSLFLVLNLLQNQSLRLISQGSLFILKVFDELVKDLQLNRLIPFCLLFRCLLWCVINDLLMMLMLMVIST